MWEPARSFAWLSPFHYFAGAAILSGGGNLPFNLSILGTVTVVAAGVAYWQFSRRDLCRNAKAAKPPFTSPSTW